MANRQVTLDVSDNIIAAAVMSQNFWAIKNLWLIEPHAAGDNTEVVVNPNANYIPIDIGAHWFLLDSVVHVDSVTDLDTGALAAGTDYYVYACTDGTTLSFKVSANSTNPTGFDAAHSRKIGGFHTLCVAVGTIGGHTLTGYVAKDILPASVWCLKHRAKNLVNVGMIYDPGIEKWVDIYLASGTGTGTTSVNGGTISDMRDWNDFVADGYAVGKRLLTDAEFQRIAAGSNEETSISTSADPVTTGGHSDTAARRMIANNGCEDCCGAVSQWLRDQSYRFDAGTLSIIIAGATLALTHDASPGGMPIYVKFGADGNPYLCSNVSTDTADKWLTFGSAYTLLVKHDASAAVGGYQVFFDEDAIQPSRLLAALPGLKDVYIPTSNPRYTLKVTYNATPGTPGVAVNYDDTAGHQRLEFISPTTTAGSLDLALLTFTDPVFSWYDLPGSKGSLYQQGTYGDIKLLAGGDWGYAAFSGSRCRAAYYSRWTTNASLGARFVADPL